MQTFDEDFLHPSDEKLSQYIEKRLNTQEREKILDHLLYCDICSEIVANILKYQIENNLEKLNPSIDKLNEKSVVNNSWFKNRDVKLLLLSGMVASLIFFIAPWKEESMIVFYTQEEYSGFKSPSSMKDEDYKLKNREINDFFLSLSESLDMEYLKLFNRAEQEILQRHFDEARELYVEAIAWVNDSSLARKEKKKQELYLNYKILLLSIEEGDEESIHEYKELLKDEVHRFLVEWH